MTAEAPVSIDHLLVFKEEIDQRKKAAEHFLRERISQFSFSGPPEEYRLRTGLDEVEGRLEFNAEFPKYAGPIPDSLLSKGFAETIEVNYNKWPDGPETVNFWFVLVPGSKILIKNVYVGPVPRQEGLVGTRIVQMLEDLALEHDCTKSVAVEVQSGRAIEMVQRLGYQSKHGGERLHQNWYKDLSPTTSSTS